MKHLWIVLLLVSVASGQNKHIKFVPLVATDSIGYAIVTIDTVPKITIRNNSKKYLTIDCSGDTVITSGTLQLDSAATLFFKYVLKDIIFSRTARHQ